MDLVGTSVVLVPMWMGKIDDLARWVGVPPAQVLARWPSVLFDDAFPQKGRMYEVDVGGVSVGAAAHHAVEGSPRAVRFELVLGPGLDAKLGADALRTLAKYVAGALGVRLFWAEVPPEDARGLEAFIGAGFRIADEKPGRVRLEHAVPATRPK